MGAGRPSPQWYVISRGNINGETMLKKLLTATTLAVITTIGACAPEDISVGFTDADITAIKESIGTEFEKRKGAQIGVLLSGMTAMVKSPTAGAVQAIAAMSGVIRIHVLLVTCGSP